MPRSAFGLIPKDRLLEYEWFQVRAFDWRELALALAELVGMPVQRAFAQELDRKVLVWYFTGADEHEVDLLEASIVKLSDPRPLIAAFNAYLSGKGAPMSILRVQGVLNDRRSHWYALVTPEEAAALEAADAVIR